MAERRSAGTCAAVMQTPEFVLVAYRRLRCQGLAPAAALAQARLLLCWDEEDVQ